MKMRLAIALCAALALPGSILANPLVEATKTCLADSTTGRDRKILGRWIFLAMASHPEIATLSTAKPADHDAASREFAALFMRLVTKDCRQEMTAMMAEGDPASAETAFQFLGEVAMQEIMSNDQVNSAISAFGNFLDEEKLAPVMAPARKAD